MIACQVIASVKLQLIYQNIDTSIKNVSFLATVLCTSVKLPEQEDEVLTTAAVRSTLPGLASSPEMTTPVFSLLVFEVTNTGKHHGHSVVVAVSDRVLVFH
jgi:hypothetical protein